VSRGLAAISSVAALRATRMWREETNHGALPDLWTAAAIRTSAAGSLLSLVERENRKVIFTMHGAAAFSRRSKRKSQIAFNHRLS